MLAIPSEVEGFRCLICKATSAGPSVRAGLAVPLGMTAIGSCLARGRQHFLEARITAQRVPIWVEPQLAITETPDSSSMGSQLLKGLVVFASPTINFCQIKKWREARRGFSGQGQKFACAPTGLELPLFAQALPELVRADSKPDALSG